MSGAFMWLADWFATGFIALFVLSTVLMIIGAFGFTMVHTLAAARRHWPVALFVAYSVLAYALK